MSEISIKINAYKSGVALHLSFVFIKNLLPSNFGISTKKEPQNIVVVDTSYQKVVLYDTVSQKVVKPVKTTSNEVVTPHVEVKKEILTPILDTTK